MPRASFFAARPLDAAIGELAGHQHGVVALRQLRGLGLSAAGVRARVRRGALVRLHRGVFAVGHAVLKPEGHRIAAVLVCGEGAVLSHRDAAAHQGIRPCARTRIEVTVPGPGHRSRPGIEIHRSTTIAPHDVVELDGVPCTSPARTLFDLAEVLGPQALARAFDQAEILRILDLRALEDVMRRNPGRHALHPVRALLSSIDPYPTLTRSELERLFLSVCNDAGLPKPELNEWLHIEGRNLQADFLWPEHRLVAETDGFATHGTRRAFERDRRRDQLLLRAGYRTVRFTWRQVTDDPAWVAETVRRGLVRS